MGGVVSDIFGGGGSSQDAFNAAQQQYQQGINAEQGATRQAQQYMNPFYQQGLTAMPGYYSGITAMANPQQFYQQMMSGYTESPQAQLQQQQATQAANAAGAASGMLGSGAEQKALAKFSQQNIAADQQNWLNNMMGIYGNYLGGLGNLYQGGQRAGEAMGGYGMQGAGDIANMYGQLGQAGYQSQMQQGRNQWQGLGSILGGLGSLASYF